MSVQHISRPFVRSVLILYCTRNASGSPFLSVAAPTAPTHHLSGNSVTECGYCHTLLLGQEVVSQGCWDTGDGCSTPCTLTQLVTQPAMLFCCCAGDGCNQEWGPAVQAGQAVLTTTCRETAALTFSVTELLLMMTLLILIILLIILSMLLTR